MKRKEKEAGVRASEGVNKVLRVAGPQLVPDKAQIEGLLFERVFDDGAHVGALEAFVKIAAEEFVSELAAALREVRRAAGEKCPVLLATVGRGPSDAAALGGGNVVSVAASRTSRGINVNCPNTNFAALKVRR